MKRDKLLGHVMGRLIYAQLENTEIDDMFILEPLTKLLRELNDEFYDKARTTPIDKFWKAFLIPRLELKYQIPTAQEETNLMIDILTSLFQRQPKINK